VRAVLLCAFLGALLGSLMHGCTQVPPVQDARQVLAKVLVYADDAVALTQAVCKAAPGSRPCEVLVSALDTLFQKAVALEDAINRGEEVSDRVAALEAELRSLRDLAENLLRSIV
jgi:DNA-binding helix-hairpin-helix protein with protein kinase domain